MVAGNSKVKSKSKVKSESKSKHSKSKSKRKYKNIYNSRSKSKSKSKQKARKQQTKLTEENIPHEDIPVTTPPTTCNYKLRPRIVDIPPLALACVTRSRLPLKSHQKLIIEHLMIKRGLIVIHAPGSGKTLPAVVLTNCFLNIHEHQKPLNGFIVTPKSLMMNFQKEMEVYGVSPFHPGLQYATFQRFAKATENDPDILLGKFVIIDEAHNLANRQSKMTKSIIQAVAKAKKVLLLTGTPMKNKITDLNTLYEMVSGKRVINEQAGPSMKELKCWISYYNCPQGEDFPTIDSHEVKFTMTPSFYRKYMEIERNKVKSVEIMDLFGLDKNLTTFWQGMRRATNALETENSPKILWTVNRLQKFQRKTLVYSFYRQSGLDLISLHLKRLGIPFAEINGTLSAAQRMRVVTAYNFNEIKILLISKAGGEGLDLKGTQDVILIDPSWNEGTEDQIIRRAARRMSHADVEYKTVDVYHLIMQKPKSLMKANELPSVDDLLKNLQRKKSFLINEFLKQLLPSTIEQSNCNYSSKRPISKG